jgi:hypothetical protein
MIKKILSISLMLVAISLFTTSLSAGEKKDTVKKECTCKSCDNCKCGCKDGKTCDCKNMKKDCSCKNMKKDCECKQKKSCGGKKKKHCGNHKK